MELLLPKPRLVDPEEDEGERHAAGDGSCYGGDITPVADRLLAERRCCIFGSCCRGWRLASEREQRNEPRSKWRGGKAQRGRGPQLRSTGSPLTKRVEQGTSPERAGPDVIHQRQV